MPAFLIVYDTKRGEVLRLEKFAQRADALDARFAAEREHRGRPDIEIVVLGASSRKALEQTHSRYFKSSRELVLAAQGINGAVA